tara:strand:- start:1571 stop:2080 length:510 start_codon:yes stop_codon:yes gene_type:complete
MNYLIGRNKKNSDKDDGSNIIILSKGKKRCPKGYRKHVKNKTIKNKKTEVKEINNSENNIPLNILYPRKNKTMNKTVSIRKNTIHKANNVKMIKLSEGRKRCPKRYRRHPTYKNYCIRDITGSKLKIKETQPRAMYLKNVKKITLKNRKRCPKGYRRNLKNKNECISIL